MVFLRVFGVLCGEIFLKTTRLATPAGANLYTKIRGGWCIAAGIKMTKITPVL